jgi:REP element-mobilizing transposase RayT
MDPPIFYSPWAETTVSHNRLPHWEQTGAVYFVTWRLADSIPQEILHQHFEERESWLIRHPEPHSAEREAEYHRLFSGKIDQWLDAGRGSCLLRHPENARAVADALHYFEGVRSRMFSYVVMPNHLHLLFALSPEYQLKDLVHSWKRHSAREINRREGRSGPLWQKDYFDRLIRDGNHFGNCVRYIRQNPKSAHLRVGEYLLFESDLAKQIE